MGRHKQKRGNRNRGYVRSRRQLARQLSANRRNRNIEQEANRGLEAALLMNAPEVVLQAAVFDIDEPMEANVRANVSEPPPQASVLSASPPVSVSPVRQVLLPTFSSTPRRRSTVGPSKKSPYSPRCPERQQAKTLRQETLKDFVSDWERRRDLPATTVTTPSSPQQNLQATPSPQYPYGFSKYDFIPPLQTPPSKSSNVSEALASESRPTCSQFEAPQLLDIHDSEPSDFTKALPLEKKKRNRNNINLLLEEAKKLQPAMKRRRTPQDQPEATSQASLDNPLLNKNLPKPPAGEIFKSLFKLFYIAR